MRDERRGVNGFHFFCSPLDSRRHIAVVDVGERIGRIKTGTQVLEDRCLRHFGIVTFIPNDGQRVERFFRAPPGIGHHCHGRFVDAQRLWFARHVRDFGLIKAHRLAAEYRTILDGRMQHAGQFDIHRVYFAAVELVGSVQTFYRLAGDFPLARIAQLECFGVRGRQFRGGSGDLTIRRRA